MEIKRERISSEGTSLLKHLASGKEDDNVGILEDGNLELSDRQIGRIDEIYNAVFEMCKVLTENSGLEWDMYYIGDIADYATNVLCLMGHKVRYPAIVTDEDGKQCIEEYHNDERT